MVVFVGCPETCSERNHDTTRHDKEKTAIIKSGIVFNNDVSEIIAFRHMVVSLAVSNHILRENTMTRKHCHNQLGS